VVDWTGVWHLHPSIYSVIKYSAFIKNTNISPLEEIFSDYSKIVVILDHRVFCMTSLRKENFQLVGFCMCSKSTADIKKCQMKAIQQC